MYARTDPPHPRRNSKGLYPLHRVLAENKLGRLLLPGEEVHHDDLDKSNNDPANLIVTTKSDHARIHNPDRGLVEVVCPCGKMFRLKAYVLRQRRSRKRDGIVTCSRRCGRLYGLRSGGLVTIRGS